MTPSMATGRTPALSRRHLLLRRLLVLWAVGYPLLALSIGAVGGWAPGRSVWLAGIAVLAWAVVRTRPRSGLMERLRQLSRRRRAPR